MTGASAEPTGPSQAEPEGVSALRASVPCVGEWVLFRGGYDLVAVECKRAVKVTPRIVKFDGGYPRQCSMVSVVASFASQEVAKQVRDSIAGVAGEFTRRRRAADDDRSRRITEALAAASKSIDRILAQAIEARRAETAETGSVHESAVPKEYAQGDTA